MNMLYRILLLLFLINWSYQQSLEGIFPSRSGRKKGQKGLNNHRREKSQYVNGSSELYELERRLAQRELEHTKTLFDTLKKRDYEIHGFYHTSTWQKYWKEVITEQLYLFDGSRKFPPINSKDETLDYSQYRFDHFQEYTSLLNLSTTLHINIATDNNNIQSFENIQKLIDSLHLRYRHKILLHSNRTIGRDVFDRSNQKLKNIYSADKELSTSEYGTIDMLQKFCYQKSIIEKKKNILIYYVHAKGTCCIKDHLIPWGLKDTHAMSRAAWREYMNAFNIEFPSICLRALVQKRYTTCGVENQDAHYSGNYWWATCDHIARLPAIDNRFDFLAPEYFVLRAHPDFEIARKFGYACGYSMNNCGVNLYDVQCHRERFREKLMKVIFHQRLIPSNRSSDGFKASSSSNKENVVAEKCHLFFQKPQSYYQQQVVMANMMKG